MNLFKKLGISLLQVFLLGRELGGVQGHPNSTDTILLGQSQRSFNAWNNLDLNRGGVGGAL